MKLPMNVTPTMIVKEMIRNTPRALDRVYLSMLSTACKNIVVNKKENTNIPIMEDKKGSISIARIPIIMNNNNL
jgi:hypothetical protein